MSGKTGTALRLWGGLLIGAGALAGLVATSATAAGADTAEAARTAGADRHLADCPPEDEAGEDEDAQTHDGPRRDGHSHLTPEEAAAYDRELREALRDQQRPGADQPATATVPVVVHIVHAEDGTGDISDATVDEQIAVLDEAFGGGLAGADTGFGFRLEDVTRTANDAWFADYTANEREIKSSLRQGGAGTLNLYISDLGESILGQATFPQDYESEPKNDGVVVDYRTVPGGSREGFNLGYTAVHETGHWLGLFHTFQNGCTKPGDYVADTAYEGEQASGCPEGRDTCPDRPGADPVHNFMDYSDDKCLDRFTEGQAERMAEHWTAFRSPESQAAQTVPEPGAIPGAPAAAPVHAAPAAAA